MKVEDIKVRKIKDSRGEPTIEVFLKTAKGSFQASVPSGKSRGRNEAAVLTPASASKAAARIFRAIRGKEFRTQSDFDRFMIALDGTKRKKKLGGNTLLGISIAFARARAAEEKKEVWELLRKEFFKSAKGAPAPWIFSNLINGGAHAKNNLAIQEYMAVAKPKKMRQAVTDLKHAYSRLGARLREKSKRPVRLGDEGGYSMDFDNAFEPIRLLEQILKGKKNFGIALDAAATSFFKGGKYRFDGQSIPPDVLAEKYAEFFKNSLKLFSLEDPFEERSPAAFALLRRGLKKAWVVGDDLTTTDPALIGRYAKAGVINAVIIKPNQIGTVSEACEAIRAARKNQAKVIVSHRSGETADAFIIQLARAANAEGVKIGAPVPARWPKFKELLSLYP